MHTLHMPRLGQTMDEGTFVRPLVAELTDYEAGTPLYELETEKVTTEVEARTPGRVVRWVAAEGAELTVGSLIAVCAEVGETPDPEDVDAHIRRSAASADGPGRAGDASSGPSSREGDGPEPPVADPASGRGTGATPPRVPASPRARALAAAHGIDLSTVRGSGPRGTVTADDVSARVEVPGPPAPAPAPPTGPTSGPPERSRTTLTRRQRAMARNLTAAWQAVPHFTEEVEVDAGALRRAVEATEDVRTLTPFVLAAVARAAADTPQVNATLVEDELVVWAEINISVAVAADEGLLTVVLPRVDALDVGQIASDLARLTAQARQGKVPLANARGGTITVSNLGMHGVDRGTPVLSHGQTALLFIGRLAPRAVVRDGAVVPRHTLPLVAAFDHRVVDGVTGARFLGTVRHLLERPEQLLG